MLEYNITQQLSSRLHRSLSITNSQEFTDFIDLAESELNGYVMNLFVAFIYHRLDKCVVSFSGLLQNNPKFDLIRICNFLERNYAKLSENIKFQVICLINSIQQN